MYVGPDPIIAETNEQTIHVAQETRTERSEVSKVIGESQTRYMNRKMMQSRKANDDKIAGKYPKKKKKHANACRQTWLTRERNAKCSSWH